MFSLLLLHVCEPGLPNWIVFKLYEKDRLSHFIMTIARIVPRIAHAELPSHFDSLTEECYSNNL
jgi:hypothetical protein